MQKKNIKHLVTAALCLALALVLPFLTGNIPQIGSALAPMHIPVLLCGFLCGPWWGLAVGLIAPPLRHVLFSAPPAPMFMAMAVELATYGLVAGLLYRLLPRKTSTLYVSLIAAMLAGRCVWGVAMTVIMGAQGGSFGWQAFIGGAFLGAIPGIIVHIVLIPILVLALQKAGYFREDR